MVKNSTIKRLPKSEVEIKLTLPWEEIKKTYDQVIKSVAESLKIDGFRPGKAPQKVIEEKVNKSKVYSEVISQVLPKYYQNALVDNNLKPLANPKITLESAEENKDWEVKILIAEKPVVDLSDYQEGLKKAGQPAKIWTPGKGSDKEEKKEEKSEEKMQDVIKWLLENIKLELSDLLLEEEINYRLSSLLDQTQKLGLTIEQYLASTGKTLETIKEEYRNQALESWKLEIILNEIADKEKITVEDREIEATIQKVKSADERQKLESQKYVLASVIRRQKTLDFLAKL